MGHWYTIQGTPVHTVIGKHGKERDTTLRDARTMNLIPSVTTVIKDVLSAPALERWKLHQALDIACEMPIGMGEFPAEWKKAVLERAEKAGMTRMEFGSLVHDSLEKAIQGKEITVLDVITPAGEPANIHQFINPVLEMIRDNGWDIVETETVKVGQGYAGTTDAVYIGADEYGILDFKTTKDASDPFIPPSYPMQIAMYHVAEHGWIDDKAAGYNIFISTERNIGTVKAVRYDAERLRKEYNAALCCVKLWQHLNNYTPAQ